MSASFRFPILLLVSLALLPLRAGADQWTVISPDHDETFINGSEKSRQWILSSGDQDLALMLTFTNDPYVDHINPRDTTFSTFHFPSIRLGADKRTFYYAASRHQSVPVATIRGSFLGFKWIELSSSAELIVKKNRSELTAILVIQDHPARRSSD